MNREPVESGWELTPEVQPSLCRHFMPRFGGGHEMRNTCWCNPILQNEADYTVVLHN